MKSVFLFLMMFVAGFSFAQTKGVLPAAADTTVGTFTEWQKATAKVDGVDATFEYRIAFKGKQAHACSYDFQVKNTYSKVLNFKIEYNYTHNGAKKNYTVEGKVKPGKVMDGELLAQGCKIENLEGKSDLETCLTCDFSYSITASKK